MRGRFGLWLIVALGGAVGLGVAVLRAEGNERAQLVEDLGAADVTTRTAAIESLATMDSSADLVGELDGPHSALVRSGFVSAARMAGPGTDDAAQLRSFLSSPRLEVRLAAAHVLQMAPTLARQDLSTRLANEQENTLVRAACAEALSGAGPSATAALSHAAADAEAPLQVRTAAIMALPGTGDSGLFKVTTLAGDTTRSDADRITAVRSLARAQARGAILGLILSPSAVVRAHVAAGLAEINNAGDAGTLATLLADAAAEVRLSALRALIDMGQDGAQAAAVRGRFVDADPRVQAMALESAGRTQAAPIATVRPQLIAALASTNFRVRYEAAMALNAYGDPGGKNTMSTDRADPNTSNALMATRAHQAITATAGQ